MLGMDIYEPRESGEFIHLVNDWFDVLDSKLCTFAYPGKVIVCIIFVDSEYI